MEEVEEEEATISLQRALADIEILFSAYPDEVRMVETSDEDISTTIVPDDSSIRRHEQHQQEQKQNHPEQNHNQHFPLYIIFQLSSTAILKLQFETGYPISSNITVVSYRCHPRETSCMEAIVTAIQNTSMECLENEMEGGLACCAVAKDLWDSYNTTSSAINNIANANEIVVDGGDGGEGGVGRILQPFVDFEHQQDEQDNDQKYNWISSATIIEKKSIFQSHVCSVRSEDDVPMALQQLKYKNTRIQRATHNMWAYRFTETTSASMTSILKHDNDDDGEDAAGGRLGHLLQMRNEDGVLVVVSRWYGGIHLGPKRFAVISNIARDGLVKYHATTTTTTSTESTSIKNKSNSDNNHHSSSSATAKMATKARKAKK